MPSEQPLNVQRLQALSALKDGDDDPFLKDLIDHFVSSAPEMMGELEAAVGERDWDRAHHAAHKMKGRAANLGGDSFAKLCQSLEDQAASGGDETTMRPLLRQLRTEFESLQQALKSYLQAP